MDIRFDLKLDTNDLQRQLQSKINDRTKDIVAGFVSTEFQSPGYWNAKPGAHYLKIRDMLDEKANSESSQAIIRTIIDEKWNAALVYATEEAIKREAMKAATKALKKQKNITQYIGN